MDTINVRGIHLRAHHGCMEEEAKIGGDYVVNVQLKGDFSVAAKGDKLSDAADYVKVYEIVKQEMKVRSHLIEHVAERIASHLKKTFTEVQHLSVEVIKKKPPMNGNVDEVSVIIEK
ncbi:MAG TPA: dihydroneopterin aldolase [Bacteroidia bacterium]|jgi:dihydroneopterin aldolase|nr:dihydroneopterin aldolase [Bacteroidia bacterium]